MRKKRIGALLAGAMAAGLLSGCGKTDSLSQNKDVTITVKVPALTMSTVADAEITDAYAFLTKAAAAFEQEYEDANVTVQIYQFEQTDEAAAIEDCFGTGDAADVIYEGYFNMATYIHSGYAVPLDDIITDEMRADINDSYWESSKLGGKTYMMPYLGLENVLAYNKELFRLCGLDRYVSEDGEVQNWTVDEWNEILGTLAKKLPENSYAMMMYASNNQGDTHIMTLLRMFGSSFFDGDGHFNLNTEEGIAALRWIKDGYDSGYFTANAPTIEINDNTSLFLNGQLGIYISNAALESVFREMEVGYVNFPSVDGEGLNTTFITGFEVFDNGDEAKLKAAKSFVKYIYESEWLDYSAGGIPCSNAVAEKYAAQLEGIQKYIDVADCGVNFTGNNPNWRGVREAFYPCIQDLLYGDKTPEETAAKIDEVCNAAIDEGYAESKLHE